MNKQSIETLISFNEEWLERLELSLKNPMQRALGDSHIKIKILEVKNEIMSLRSQLSAY